MTVEVLGYRPISRHDAELAQRLHRPQTFVSKVESGHRRVDILELLDILKALEADPHAFVDEVMTLNKYDTQAGA